MHSFPRGVAGELRNKKYEFGRTPVTRILSLAYKLFSRSSVKENEKKEENEMFFPLPNGCS